MPRQTINPPNHPPPNDALPDDPPAYDPPAYDPHALFALDGPINPHFVTQAVRALMRTLPLDSGEPPTWVQRRLHSALLALAALHPRDEIELMIGVQAVSAWHAAAAGWRLGMNHHRPRGDSTRHLSAAAAAARCFDSLLRALERRQAKPLAVPPGRPANQVWPELDPLEVMQQWEQRVRADSAPAATDPAATASPHHVVWTPQAIAMVNQRREADRIAKENEGLDLANTEGILPGGGMIMPAHPTPQQEAYMGRRLTLAFRREYQENLRRGIKQYPKIRHIRPGDLIE